MKKGRIVFALDSVSRFALLFAVPTELSGSGGRANSLGFALYFGCRLNISFGYYAIELEFAPRFSSSRLFRLLDSMLLSLCH